IVSLSFLPRRLAKNQSRPAPPLSVSAAAASKTVAPAPPPCSCGPQGAGPVSPRLLREGTGSGRGGRRDAPRQAGDLAGTGVTLSALKAGEMAGLKVPPATLKLAARFLDAVEKQGGYRYTPGGQTPPLTAVGLLCRQSLGTQSPNVGKAIEYLRK